MAARHICSSTKSAGIVLGLYSSLIQEIFSFGQQKPIPILLFFPLTVSAEQGREEELLSGQTGSELATSCKAIATLKKPKTTLFYLSLQDLSPYALIVLHATAEI